MIFLLTLLLTGLMVVLAKKFNLVDSPGVRRTHGVITPRGGGIAIVLVATSVILKPIYVAAFSIACLGFWDDISNLSARFRLVVQCIVAALTIYCLNEFRDINLFGFMLPAMVFLVLAVWVTNLYNFMDGINGLAGCEAIFFALGMAFITKQDTRDWYVLASATLGFLVWNFPRARIFLGDVGSQFFGFLFASILVKEAIYSETNFVCALILLGFFIVDTSFTLIVRLLTSQKLTQAHRTHLYQLLWKKMQSHSKVTLLIMLINIYWLLPCAYLVAEGYLHSSLGLLISYAPLVIMAVFFRAGYLPD